MTAGPGGRLAAPAERAADVGGRVLSVLINRVYGLGRARPLHPRGVTRAGTWTVEATAPTPTGAPCLDRPGAVRCVVRHSRAVGLPSRWPDIEGMAVRLEGEDGGDLLVAGTGDGRLARHLLVPRWADGTCSTLVPLRTPSGPVLVRLRPAGADRWEVAWSRPGGDWHPVGTLALEEDSVAAPHFDPAQHPPRGLEHYPAVARLRRPAYARARHQARRRA